VISAKLKGVTNIEGVFKNLRLMKTHFPKSTFKREEAESLKEKLGDLQEVMRTYSFMTSQMKLNDKQLGYYQTMGELQRYGLLSEEEDVFLAEEVRPIVQTLTQNDTHNFNKLKYIAALSHLSDSTIDFATNRLDLKRIL